MSCNKALGHYLNDCFYKCKHSSGFCRWPRIIRYRFFRSETHRNNRMMKYADDTYRLVASTCRYINTAQEEFDNISQWAERNNLQLNASKTKKLIFFRRS